MPFVIKDVLHHKRNDRQKREIHEREYSIYLTNLRQQQQKQNSYYSNQYYLSSNHIDDIKRSRIKFADEKRNQFDRIYRENTQLYDRLLKANKRPMVDDKNYLYQQNLKISSSKRLQQRNNDYTRIYNENQTLLKRINNVQANLMTKQECDNNWRKQINIMKKTSDYPENIEKFVTKMNQHEQNQACVYSKMRSAQWNKRHCIIEPSSRLTVTPLALLLDES
jgi:hypothetical protein